TAKQVPAVDDACCEKGPNRDRREPRKPLDCRDGEIIPVGLLPLTGGPKQQCERRQAAKPGAGRKQVQRVGGDMEVAPHTRRRTGMTREGGQGKESGCGGNRPGALRWSQNKEPEGDSKHQSKATNRSEACIGEHRPGSAVETNIS